MRGLVIQAPPGALALTIEDDDGRDLYFFSPIDYVLRAVRLPLVETPMREHIRPATVQHTGDGRILCPVCDGWPVDCRMCETDGTISEIAMVIWMTARGTVVGDG